MAGCGYLAAVAHGDGYPVGRDTTHRLSTQRYNGSGTGGRRSTCLWQAVRTRSAPTRLWLHRQHDDRQLRGLASMKTHITGNSVDNHVCVIMVFRVLLRVVAQG